MTEHEKQLLLLQITDSVFPIGGYAHSYGLETYVQKGLVSNEKQAKEYVEKYIVHSMTYTDLAAIRFAYESLAHPGLESIFEMEEKINASRGAMEIQAAGIKLAIRFIKTVAGYVPKKHAERWNHYMAGRAGIKHPYAVAYGVFCALSGIEMEQSITAFAYNQVSAMVVNCVKSIPLSQTAGQNILFSMQGEIIRAVEAATVLPESHFLKSSPGFELRGMQHEALYSRLYMS